MNCGIAQAQEVLGDWWTFLIIRDAFFGVSRFSDFVSTLGIAENVLADRLENLVEHEIMERVDVGTRGTRFEYQLTDKGLSLLPVLVSLGDWGNEWVFGRGNEPVVVKERATGRRVPRLTIRNSAGKSLRPADIKIEPGPGASAATRRRFGSNPRSS